MDPTSTHFGFYDAFPVATPVPGGGQPAQSQDDWAHLRYNYDQLMPVHGRGFINLAPPNPRLFYPYNPDPLSTISFHPIVGAHVERLEFQDPVDCDPASPHPINPRFALDQPISTPPPCVDEVEDAISHGVDYTSPAQIWSHIDVDDDGACVCLWKDVLGGACGFRSSADRVKRHLLRVHFGLKGPTRPVRSRRVFTNHLNARAIPKPYKCYHCELRFIAVSARAFHRKSLHSWSQGPIGDRIVGGEDMLQSL